MRFAHHAVGAAFTLFAFRYDLGQAVEPSPQQVLLETLRGRRVTKLVLYFGDERSKRLHRQAPLHERRARVFVGFLASRNRLLLISLGVGLGLLRGPFVLYGHSLLLTDEHCRDWSTDRQ